MKKEDQLYLFAVYYRMKLKNYYFKLEKYEAQHIKEIHERKSSKLLGAVCM